LYGCAWRSATTGHRLWTLTRNNGI
jgi:hypothetical protein